MFGVARPLDLVIGLALTSVSLVLFGNENHGARPCTARLLDNSQLFHLLYHTRNLVSVEKEHFTYWLFDWGAVTTWC